MEQKLINQFADELECLKKDEKKLLEFQGYLEQVDLPSDVKRKINLEILNELDIYSSEIAQIETDIN